MLNLSASNRTLVLPARLKLSRWRAFKLSAETVKYDQEASRRKSKALAFVHTHTHTHKHTNTHTHTHKHTHTCHTHTRTHTHTHTFVPLFVLDCMGVRTSTCMYTYLNEHVCRLKVPKHEICIQNLHISSHLCTLTHLPQYITPTSRRITVHTHTLSQPSSQQDATREFLKARSLLTLTFTNKGIQT